MLSHVVTAQVAVAGAVVGCLGAVGIKLKDVEPMGRLEASKSFNSMVTHRVRVECFKDVDKELVGWLRQAHKAAS